MNNPCISIIIPLYNKSESIKTTVNSVLSQSFVDFELIIVNDGSTDNSLQIVLSIKDDRIVIYNKKNGGVSSARNYGIDAAKGKWIVFLDADDILYPECLASLIKPTYNSCVDIVCAKFHFSDEYNKKISSTFNYEGIVPNNYRWFFLSRYSVRMGCALIRKEIVSKNKFNEDLSRFEDMQSILNWIRGSKIYILNIPVMSYCIKYRGLSQASSNIEKDFSFHMVFKNKDLWEKCKLGELLYLAYITYPHKRKVLCEMYKTNVIYAIIAKMSLILKKLRSKINRHHENIIII